MTHFSGFRILLAGSALFVTHAARADSVGWVWYSGGATPYPEYTHNSSGGQVRIAQTETGFYTVTFSGLGGVLANNGVAVASGYRSNASCQVGTIAPAGPDMTVQVDCWNAQGGQVNTDFSLFYEQRSSPIIGRGAAYVDDTTPSAAIGTAYAADATGTYNSTGGFNTITHTATGAYSVTMPGLSHFGGTVQVTAGGNLDAANGGFSARCQVTGWSVVSAATVALVTCVDGNDAPVDTYFRLAYSIDAASDRGFGRVGVAYAWADRLNATASYPPRPGYQFNNYTSGQLSAYRYSGTGEYVVNMPVGATPASTVAIVNAHDLPGGYCNVVDWSNNYVQVDCYNAAGQLADGQFDFFYGAAF